MNEIVGYALCGLGIFFLFILVIYCTSKDVSICDNRIDPGISAILLAMSFLFILGMFLGGWYHGVFSIVCGLMIALFVISMLSLGGVDVKPSAIAGFISFLIFTLATGINMIP